MQPLFQVASHVILLAAKYCTQRSISPFRFRQGPAVESQLNTRPQLLSIHREGFRSIIMSLIPKVMKRHGIQK
jgi:hypothetical protein